MLSKISLRNIIKATLLFFFWGILVSEYGEAQISNYWGCGSSFVTCGPSRFNVQSGTFLDGQVCGIIDVRQTCDFKKAPAMQQTDTYANKMFSPLNSDWNFSNLGTVFGIAVDKRGDIFLAATTTFGSIQFPDGLTPNGGRGSGSIYKIDGSTGLVNTTFVTTNQSTTYNSGFPTRLPNQTFTGNWGPVSPYIYTIKSGPGLGDLAYNEYHDFIYVSNFEDGKIYKINPITGNIENVFDPTFGEGNPAIALDNGSAGFAPRGQRPWGLGINKYGSTIRLFYALWNIDEREYLLTANNLHNEIWSVELDNFGNPISTTEQLEIVLPYLNTPFIYFSLPFSSNPVSDIAFSENGDLLLVEKGMFEDIGYTLLCGGFTNVKCNTAHHARLLRYQNIGGIWTLYNNPLFYQLAGSSNSTNSSGGVDVGYNTCDLLKPCDSLIWVTGDYNHIISDTSVQVYGMAGIEFGNGSATNHRYVDFNGVLNNSQVGITDKQEIGDVEIFRCDVSCVSCCDSIKIMKIDSCCSRISSFCTVKSVQVQIQNGVILSASWNCGPISGAYLDKPGYTFVSGTPCPLDLELCVRPLSAGDATILYTITFEDNTTCTVEEKKRCPCALITGEAWYDQNGDGVYQQVENGINGLQIELVDVMTGQVVFVSETVTKPGTASDDGYYEFPCVKPGMYFVRFDQPGDFEVSLPFQGTDPDVDSDITGQYGDLTTNKITVNHGDTLGHMDGGFMDRPVSSGGLRIGGLITNPYDKPLSNILIHLELNGNRKVHFSNHNGNYAFYDVLHGMDYKVRPENDENPVNGVSTLDIILIQKHILGQKLFDNPYKYIAADVNLSKSITASDITELRKLILGITQDFANNHSWRFVPRSFEFSNPKSPYTFPEQIELSQLDKDQMRSDFYGIKTGDVSGNASNYADLYDRTDRSYEIGIVDQDFEKGKIIKVPVYSTDAIDINGMQLALSYSAELKFRSVESGKLNILREQYTDSKGEFRLSYTSMDRDQIHRGELLFSLEFEAFDGASVAKCLKLGTSINPELYDQNDEGMGLVLSLRSWADEEKTGNYKMYPAIPNPFEKRTNLEFDIPVSEEVRFSIFNLSGELVYEKTSPYPQGKNSILIDQKDLGRPGIYLVQMSTSKWIQMQRIALLSM